MPWQIPTLELSISDITSSTAEVRASSVTVGSHPQTPRSGNLQMCIYLCQKVSAQPQAHCFPLETPLNSTPETRTMTMIICAGDHRADCRGVCPVLYSRKLKYYHQKPHVMRKGRYQHTAPSEEEQ